MVQLLPTHVFPHAAVYFCYGLFAGNGGSVADFCLGSEAAVDDGVGNVGSWMRSGRKSAESGPNAWNVTSVVADAGNRLDRWARWENDCGSVVTKMKIFFSALFIA